jgi:hypothetical protein
VLLAKNKFHKICVEFHSLIQSLDTVSTFGVNARQFSQKVHELTLDFLTLDSQLLAQCLEVPLDNITCLNILCLLLVTLLIK